MKIVLKLLALIPLFYYASQFCEDKTDGFTLTRIHSDLPFRREWEVKGLSLDKTLFEQSFSYLGRGGQCYAFVSEDGKYVIKFFKHHLRRLPFWLKILPLPASLNQKRKLQQQKRQQKLLRDFQSYKLAYENLPQETGLLYLHLNKTKTLNQHVRIVDKLGIEHKISLDRVEFILQKKATLAYPYLTDLIETDQLDLAKEALCSIRSLILSRCAKGIFDEDAKIHRNFGFIDNQAMLIDVGRLKIDYNRQDAALQENDLKEITERLQGYLEKICPELAVYLEQLCHV